MQNDTTTADDATLLDADLADQQPGADTNDDANDIDAEHESQPPAPAPVPTWSIPSPHAHLFRDEGQPWTFRVDFRPSCLPVPADEIEGMIRRNLLARIQQAEPIEKWRRTKGEWDELTKRRKILDRQLARSAARYSTLGAEEPSNLSVRIDTEDGPVAADLATAESRVKALKPIIEQTRARAEKLAKTEAGRAALEIRTGLAMFRDETIARLVAAAGKHLTELLRLMQGIAIAEEPDRIAGVALAAMDVARASELDAGGEAGQDAA